MSQLEQTGCKAEVSQHYGEGRGKYSDIIEVTRSLTCLGAKASEELAARHLTEMLKYKNDIVFVGNRYVFVLRLVLLLLCVVLISYF